MTVAVALVDPPREGVVCSDIVEETPLSPAAGVALYEAMLADFFATTAKTTADVLVNYPAPEMLPGDDGDPAEEIRAVAERVLEEDDLEHVRFEVQVGSTPSARIGNALTHLLRDEEEHSAAFVDHRAPLLDRSVVDQAAIALRRNDTVVGPATDGGLYLAGFTEPIDFADVLRGSPLENVVSRATAEDHDVDFVRRREVVRTPRDLKTLVSLLRARRMAGRPMAAYTTAQIEEIGLRVEDGELVVSNGDDR